MAQESPQKQLSRKDLRVVAAVAEVDERTAAHVLAGVKTHASSAARVRAAMLSLGLAPAEPLARATLPAAR